MSRSAPPSRADSPSRRSAPSTSRTTSTRPGPCSPLIRRTGRRRWRRLPGRAQGGSRATPRGGPGRGRARPYLRAASEAGHDPAGRRSRALFKRLHLANARRVWRDLVRRAEQETWGYRDFLTLLVAEEIAHRQQTRLARLSRRARFPFLKTIDDFNFLYQTSLRLTMLGSALASGLRHRRALADPHRQTRPREDAFGAAKGGPIYFLPAPLTRWRNGLDVPPTKLPRPRTML